MLRHSTRKLTMMVTVLALFAVGLFALADHKGKPHGGGGGGKGSPPSGPGLISFNEEGGVISIMNPDGTGKMPVGLGGESAWSHEFSDGTVKLALRVKDNATNTSWWEVVNIASGGSLEISEPASIPGLLRDGIIGSMDWSPSVPLVVDGVEVPGFESVRVCFSVGDDDVDGKFHVRVEIVDLIYEQASGNFIADPDVEPLVLDAGPGIHLWYPTFSPDGTMLALARFERFEDGSTNNTIWLINSDGSGAFELIDSVGSVDSAPAWSPDGSMLAFSSNRDFERNDIYIYDIFLGTTLRLTSTNKARESFPTWSPDGSQLAFHVTTDRGWAVWKLVFETGEKYELAKGRLYRPGGWPDWSPMDLPTIQ